MAKEPGSYIVAKLEENGVRFLAEVLVLASPQDAIRSAHMGPGRYMVVDVVAREVAEYDVKAEAEVKVRRVAKRG